MSNELDKSELELMGIVDDSGLVFAIYDPESENTIYATIEEIKVIAKEADRMIDEYKKSLNELIH